MDRRAESGARSRRRKIANNANQAIFTQHLQIRRRILNYVLAHDYFWIILNKSRERQKYIRTLIQTAQVTK